MTNALFIPEFLNGIGDDLIAESEAFVRGSKVMKTNRSFRKATILIAAIIMTLALVSLSAFLLYRAGLFPTSDTTVPEEPHNYFIIENGVLISYLGNETEVTIPEGVVSISATAFPENTSIQTITLSSTVSNVESGWSDACKNLSLVKVAEEGKMNASEGLVVSSDQKSIIFVNKNELSADLVIPEGIEKIEASFKGAKALKSVTFPSTLKEIPPRAFVDCTSLTRISFGGVETVGSYAFSNCSALCDVDFIMVRKIDIRAFNSCKSLKTITMPNIRNIEEEAFYDCRLVEIDCGDHLRTIGQWAFYGDGLYVEILLPATVESIGRTPFYPLLRKHVTFKGTQEAWDAIKENGIEIMTVDILVCLGETVGPPPAEISFKSNGDGTCYVSRIG